MIIEGTSIGTTTDLDGKFTLVIPEGTNTDGNLVVSYTGFSSQTLPILKVNSTLNVRLEVDAFQLQDAVVTANKRLEASQNVLLSISTLSPLDLKRTGSFESKDYFSSIPNLSATASGGGGNTGFGDGRSSGENIAIRGVSGDKTTAMYLDDTPLPEFADPKLFDAFTTG